MTTTQKKQAILVKLKRTVQNFHRITNMTDAEIDRKYNQLFNYEHKK